MRDHLGSVRTVLAILEQNDYLPFGMRIDLDSLAYDQSNRYRFNGKEEQTTGGIGLTDYGARYYDSQLPRWTTIDPLAEKYYSISPYAFCYNNPVNFVDPDGEAFETALDIISVVSGVKNLIQNIQAGNVKDAILDGAGVVVDVVAAAVPLLPGGVGILRAAKVVNGVDNVVDAAKAANIVDDAITATKGTDVVVSATRGETTHTKLGRKMHQEYNPGDGYVKEYKLPSGKRADAVNETIGDVRELKPNNPRAIKRDEQQVKTYKKELESKYPDISWEWHIDVYDK